MEKGGDVTGGKMSAVVTMGLPVKEEHTEWIETINALEGVYYAEEI